MELINDNDSFTKKISVLHETPPLWSEEDFNNIKNLKACKDKLDKMLNINYYIKSEDLSKIINSTDKKIYLRLVIDSPSKYKKTELVSVKQDNEDIMSISDSPGRNKSLVSKSSENIKERKSRRSIKNISDGTDYQKNTISIKSKIYHIYFIKDEEKHSVFLCHTKDDIIYCTFINDKDIKGSKFSKLLTYEQVDVNIKDNIITVNSKNIKILTFPIYFILQQNEITIEDFISIIESIFEDIY